MGKMNTLYNNLDKTCIMKFDTFDILRREHMCPLAIVGISIWTGFELDTVVEIDLVTHGLTN